MEAPSPPILSGACLCGAVRYELLAEPVWAHACHCSRCRRTTGSAFAANLFFPLDALHWVEGETLLRHYAPPEAERFTTTFCSRCGSTLPFRNEARGLVVVPMGSLDVDPDFRLLAHIWVESKAPWYEIADTLPRHPTALGSGDGSRS
jgi:hypothetical protein